MYQNKKNSIEAFIYSMLNAIITGAVLALLAIYIFNNYTYFFKDYYIDNTAITEEHEEDPTLASRISDSIIYSSDPNQELKAIPDDYLPKKSSRNISAKAYMVINITNDKVILEKNINTLYPIASITKLITAVMSRRLINQDSYITINSSILNTYGNEAKLRQGEKLKAKELLFPLLMISSNDSAEALAKSYSKGRQNFLREMNSFVNVIGAYRTYFADPTGLSAQNLSTIDDLATITKWIVNNDSEIFDITLEKTKTIKAHTWTSPTHFLNLIAYAGGKNGYTTEANRTSVALFKLGKNKELFAVILLGSSRRDSDTLDLLDEAVR